MNLEEKLNELKNKVVLVITSGRGHHVLYASSKANVSLAYRGIFDDIAMDSLDNISVILRDVTLQTQGVGLTVENSESKYEGYTKSFGEAILPYRSIDSILLVSNSKEN